ncbi:unnamed protein product [Blepharisma stoltei]|uniref:Uncharacterized protein n=1 Tax=Blepharisma stoltei TaxID=1481888 RepID=A0AAU9J0X1_9CILI|nr:unnamed protein product [Blepharisma stoltei]
MENIGNQPLRQHQPNQNYIQLGPDGRLAYTPLMPGAPIPQPSQVQGHVQLPAMSIPNTAGLHQVKASRDRWANRVICASIFMMMVSFLHISFLIFKLFNLDQEPKIPPQMLVLKAFIISTMLFVAWLGIRAGRLKSSKHAKLYFKALVLLILVMVVCIGISIALVHTGKVRGNYGEGKERKRYGHWKEIKGGKHGHYDKKDHGKWSPNDLPAEEPEELNPSLLQNEDYSFTANEESQPDKPVAGVSFVSPEDFFEARPKDYWHDANVEENKLNLDGFYDFDNMDNFDDADNNDDIDDIDDVDDYDDIDEDSNEFESRVQGHGKHNHKGSKNHKKHKHHHEGKHFRKHGFVGGMIALTIVFSVIGSFLFCARKLYRTSREYEALAYSSLPDPQNYVQMYAAQPYGAVPANNVGYYPHLAPVGSVVQ